MNYNGFDNFNTGSYFIPRFKGNFYFRFKATQTYNDGSLPIVLEDQEYNEFGFDPVCQQWKNDVTQLTKDTDSSEFDLAVGETKLFRINFTYSDINGKTSFEISGTKLAARHAKGLWYLDSEQHFSYKLEEGGYGLHTFENLTYGKVGHFIFAITNVDNAAISGAKVKVSIH